MKIRDVVDWLGLHPKINGQHLPMNHVVGQLQKVHVWSHFFDQKYASTGRMKRIVARYRLWPRRFECLFPSERRIELLMGWRCLFLLNLLGVRRGGIACSRMGVG